MVLFMLGIISGVLSVAVIINEVFYIRNQETKHKHKTKIIYTEDWTFNLVNKTTFFL